MGKLLIFCLQNSNNAFICFGKYKTFEVFNE